MFDNLFRTAGALALAGAVLFLTSGTTEAAGHGGGGHGGGFHGGGFHGGGFHGGGFHGGGFHGGFHSFGFHDGFHRPFYGGFGYYPYYSYGYYPSYNDYYPSYGTYDDSYLDLGSGSTYVPQSGDPAGNGNGTIRIPSAAALAPVEPSASPALLTVRVPADAEVLIDGNPTTSTGAVREYRSPPLKPGSAYTYEVRARWQENGHTVTQTHRVDVSAGAHAATTFPTPSDKGD
jgi:uncharacterized protein (TIGR03000 family)